MAVYPFMLEPEHNAFRPIDEHALLLCTELGLEAVDLSSAFEGRDPREMWAHPTFDSHPDGAANGLAAEHLAAFLARD